jgi:hypothetical protein
MVDTKVSAVIVNYNTREILADCLANLQKDYSSLEIIVVDNNSPDNSAEMVSSKFPQVKLLALKKNIGLAAGNNAGLKKAKGEYILFLGSDAFPQENAIDKLVSFMDKNTGVGVCVGEVRLRDGKRDADTHRGFPTPWVAFTHFSGLERLFPKSRIFGGYFLGYKDLKKVHDIDLCTSHFMLTRGKIFDEVGYWDEDFFVYGEDVDLCWRVKKAGWRIVYVPGAKVLHYKGVSVGTRKETRDITKATRETKKKMILESTQAMLKFYRKHYKGKIYSPFILTGIRTLSFFRSLKVRLGIFNE